MKPSSLLLVGFEGVRPPEALLALVAAGRIGGVLWFARNVGTVAEVAAAVRAVGAATPAGTPPLVVTLDQEGGRVQRIKEPLTRWPPMARVGERDDEAVTEAVGRAMGAELRLLGFNVDLAPVLDVRTNPANEVIGDRAFARDAPSVTRHGLAFWRGLEAAGVRGCAKHFPGHGDTLQDSHLELPRLDTSLERLRTVELPPFAAAVQAGVPMVMTAHVVMAAVDAARPATISAAWIDGILRGELGFEGVVISDDLDMKAVADRFSVEEVIRGGLAAGVDLFLACRDPERQRAAMTALDEAALDPQLGPAVTRALARAHKFRSTLGPAVPVSDEELARALPDPTHQALASSL